MSAVRDGAQLSAMPWVPCAQLITGRPPRARVRLARRPRPRPRCPNRRPHGEWYSTFQAVAPGMLANGALQIRSPGSAERQRGRWGVERPTGRRLAGRLLRRGARRWSASDIDTRVRHSDPATPVATRRLRRACRVVRSTLDSPCPLDASPFLRPAPSSPSLLPVVRIGTTGMHLDPAPSTRLVHPNAHRPQDPCMRRARTAVERSDGRRPVYPFRGVCGRSRACWRTPSRSTARWPPHPAGHAGCRDWTRLRPGRPRGYESRG